MPPEFTTEDADEREKKLSEGFAHWNKRDFFKFISMCEIFGRERCDLYHELIALGKSVEQIEAYAEAFWKKYEDIKNYKKYLERIERGEQELERRNSIDRAIEDKFAQLKKDYLSSHGDLKDF